MRLESGNRFLTHFGFLLEVEFVDLLQLAFQSEEEGGLVGLQGGLRVLEGQAVGLGLLGGEDGGFAQMLDELFGGVSRDCRCRCWACWTSSHLLERLVVYKASCILWYVELSLLDVLAELPAMLVVSRVATAWRCCGSATATYMMGGWWSFSDGNLCGQTRLGQVFCFRRQGFGVWCWGRVDGGNCGIAGRGQSRR
jgi:hypothetical protein